MSAPDSTVVVPPTTPAPAAASPAAASPAAPPVTVEHISALHRHLDELGSWIAQKFKEVVALVEKAAPIAETAAAAVAPMLGAAGAPVVAAVEKVVAVVGEIAACCGHAIHFGPCATNCPTCAKKA